MPYTFSACLDYFYGAFVSISLYINVIIFKYLYISGFIVVIIFVWLFYFFYVKHFELSLCMTCAIEINFLELGSWQCWGKLLLKVMHYNIASLPKNVTNYVT